MFGPEREYAGVGMFVLFVVLPLVALAVLCVAIVVGVVYARRMALEREARELEKRKVGSASASLGRELFGRALRVDAVLEEVTQARAISSGSFLEADIEALCRQIEADAGTQHAAIRRVAPMSGRAREIALDRVDPAIAELETAGAALRDLTQRLADELGPASGSGADLERRAQAIRETIDELDALTDISYSVDDLLPSLGSGRAGDADTDRERPEPVERPSPKREPPASAAGP